LSSEICRRLVFHAIADVQLRGTSRVDFHDLPRSLGTLILRASALLLRGNGRCDAEENGEARP
jgi:hypothetical protein